MSVYLLYKSHDEIFFSYSYYKYMHNILCMHKFLCFIYICENILLIQCEKFQYYQMMLLRL